MMRAEDVLYEVGDQRESQTVEFKASLGRQKEAIQTMVAFANRDGGWLFFGVTDDGTRKGVQMGRKTLEDLAAAIRDHTYPSLPVGIEAIPSRDGRKHTVAVEVPADVPPVIGVYVCSAKAIPPNKPVDTSEVQAYRRVGRTNQKEDFMRLRQPQPSDPKLSVVLLSAQVYEGEVPRLLVEGRVWVDERSSTAHGATFRLDPFGCEASERYADLPYPSLKREDDDRVRPYGYEGFTTAGDFSFRTTSPSKALPPRITVVATFKDDWGLTWDVSRHADLVTVEQPDRTRLGVVDRGEFSRRIAAFPPKAR